MVLWALLAFLAAAVAAVSISGRGKSFCTLQTDGQVYCFGENDAGSFGIGAHFHTVQFPMQMLGISRATDVSHGDRHTCVVDIGAVKCAGENYLGQLGIDSQEESVVPAVARNFTEPVQRVFVGSYHHSCALMRSGALKCWGLGDSGQLGNDELTTVNSVPLAVKGFVQSGVYMVALGYAHTCIITTKGGVVMCTGKNNYGQIAQPNTVALRWVMTEVVGLQGAAGISAGDFHTCVVLAGTGAVRCWGDNYFGTLGLGNEETLGVSFVPRIPIGLDSGARSVFCGDLSTFVLTDNGTVLRFGYTWQIQDVNATLYDYEPAGLVVEGGGVKEIHGGSALCLVDAGDRVRCMGSEDDVWTTVPFQLATHTPTVYPTRPTKRPTRAPTPRPTTAMPTKRPSTARPSKAPTATPTKRPTTVWPSKAPTATPTKRPTTAWPSKAPTAMPTKRPTTAWPTKRPITAWPTLEPTVAPSTSPSQAPSSAPSQHPSNQPTFSPTPFPTTRAPTSKPTTLYPTTRFPSSFPTTRPKRA